MFLRFLDFIVPRFVTDDAAFCYNEVEDTFELICHIDDLYEDEEYHAIGRIKSFNLFGYGLFSKLHSLQIVDERVEKIYMDKYGPKSIVNK
jgi:hypothetical protein